MSKAEDFAYQKYHKDKKGVLYDLARNSIIQGYHQAEKDLELSWEDMKELYIIFAEVDTEIELCKADNIESETIGYYQEVLKRFKAKKNVEQKV